MLNPASGNNLLRTHRETKNIKGRHYTKDRRILLSKAKNVYTKIMELVHKQP